MGGASGRLPANATEERVRKTDRPLPAPQMDPQDNVHVTLFRAGPFARRLDRFWLCFKDCSESNAVRNTLQVHTIRTPRQCRPRSQLTSIGFRSLRTPSELQHQPPQNLAMTLRTYLLQSGHSPERCSRLLSETSSAILIPPKLGYLLSFNLLSLDRDTARSHLQDHLRAKSRGRSLLVRHR